MRRSPRVIVALLLVSAALAVAAFSGARAASGLLNDLPLLSDSFAPQAPAGEALQSTPALQPAAPAPPVNAVEAKHPADVNSQSTSHLGGYRGAKRQLVQRSLRG